MAVVKVAPGHSFYMDLLPEPLARAYETREGKEASFSLLWTSLDCFEFQILGFFLCRIF